MKVMLTVILILMIQTLQAPPNGTGAIFESEGVNPFESLWQATCKVESNFNPFAVGDKHLKEWSYGVAQIRRVRLDDYFKRTGIRYTTDDMFCPEKSRQVFMFYCSQNQPHEIMKTSKAWNGTGPMTISYWRKIQQHLN